MIAPSFSFPPLECWLGVKPSDAAKSRPDLKTLGSGRLAAIAEAISGPMAGISCSKRLIGCFALAAAIVFSLGSKYMEIYAALTLGLYAVNPVWGVVGAALWPLLGHKGLSTYIVALLTAGAGLVLASGSTKVFVPEAAMVFTAFAGLACARVFSAVENLSVRWYLISLDSALSILWATLTIVFLSPPLPVWEPAGLVFGIVFVLAFGVGKFLNTRRPRFFRALAGLSPEIFSREIFSAEFMSEKRGETVSLTQTRARVWLFEMIESQTYLALLLGLLGLFLLKGLR